MYFHRLFVLYSKEKDYHSKSYAQTFLWLELLFFLRCFEFRTKFQSSLYSCYCLKRETWGRFEKKGVFIVSWCMTILVIVFEYDMYGVRSNSMLLPPFRFRCLCKYSYLFVFQLFQCFGVNGNQHRIMITTWKDFRSYWILHFPSIFVLISLTCVSSVFFNSVITWMYQDEEEEGSINVNRSEVVWLKGIC